MAHRVFVTGGSGFVGSNVLDELLSRGHVVTALVHRGSLPLRHEALRPIQGDLFDSRALSEGLSGCDAIIHLVGIIAEKPRAGVTFERIHFDGTRAVVDAAKAAGVRRFIHMSALGTRAGAISEYHRTKWKAEEYVRESALDWTILRPSLIHGPGGFMKSEAAWARKQELPFLFMPYFGSGLLGLGGSGLLQPVYVRDVARAFVDCLDKPQTIRKTYDVAGLQRLSWPEFHRLVSTALLGHGRWSAPLPVWAARVMAGIGLGAILGFNRDQIIMSQEDNVADPAALQQDFGWTPRAFDQTLREYASKL